MKKQLINIIIAASVIAGMSACEKTDTENSSQEFSNFKADVFTSPELSMTAYRPAGDFGSGYECLELINQSESDAEVFRYMSITIFSPYLEQKTYVIPEYTSEKVYKLPSGYATCYLAEGNASAITASYYSQYMKGATGSITIQNISDREVTGTYDIIVVSNVDMTKTVHLEGRFKAAMAASLE